MIANLRGRLLGTVRHQFGLITLNQTSKSARALTQCLHVFALRLMRVSTDKRSGKSSENIRTSFTAARHARGPA